MEKLRLILERVFIFLMLLTCAVLITGAALAVMSFIALKEVLP